MSTPTCQRGAEPQHQAPGGSQLTYDDCPLQLLHASPRLQSLLAYLLLHQETPQSRAHLAGRFWADLPESPAPARRAPSAPDVQDLLEEVAILVRPATVPDPAARGKGGGPGALPSEGR